MEWLQYLARQAMAMQGDTGEESNFNQLLKLRGKDHPVILKWLERRDNKYTSQEIQNEIISIMAKSFGIVMVTFAPENAPALKFTEMQNSAWSQGNLALCFYQENFHLPAHASPQLKI